MNTPFHCFFMHRCGVCDPHVFTLSYRHGATSRPGLQPESREDRATKRAVSKNFCSFAPFHTLSRAEREESRVGERSGCCEILATSPNHPAWMYPIRVRKKMTRGRQFVLLSIQKV